MFFYAVMVSGTFVSLEGTRTSTTLGMEHRRYPRISQEKQCRVWDERPDNGNLGLAKRKNV